jgi:ribonuclease HII
MNQFYQGNNLEVGLDEAGRGCLIGPVCIGAVIMNDIRDIPCPYEIKDSKKCSARVRAVLREYIEENAIAFNVQMVHEEEIDKENILQATMIGMHRCLDDITSVINIDKILVDGTYFPIYSDKYSFEPISHICIPGGDDKYLNIAAASILAKEYHDEYIMNLCEENHILNKYDIMNNKGYGTKSHMDALKEYGPTQWHRKSFKPCQK